MKYVAAYLLAQLATATAAGNDEEGAPAAPGKAEVRRILDSVGAVVEEDRLEVLFAELEGKDFADLIAAGSERFAYAPCGAVGVAAPAGAVGGAAAEEAKEEEKKEEEKIEEEDDEAMFSLFDD